MPQNFREHAVQQETMYDYAQSDAIRSMLEQSPTNSRVNMEMARVCAISETYSEHWEGGWKGFTKELSAIFQRHYLQMDGFARVQAIDMAKAHSSTEQALGRSEQEQEGGLFSGMFGH
jgi:hypothetical protein